MPTVIGSTGNGITSSGTDGGGDEKQRQDSLGLVARALGISSGIKTEVAAEVERQLQEALPEEMREEFLRRISGDAVAKLINAAVEHQINQSHPAIFVHVTDSLGERRILNRQHYLFPAALSLLNAQDHNGNRLNVALVGPAGTGKTSMAIFAAEALSGEAVMLVPFNKHSTKSDILGYMDAQGRYVPSPLYRAMKEGLLYIADEFDACDPGIATILNGAIANRKVTFPNLETVKAHPNFRAVFCMNTYGTGGNDQYTGRNRLDAATLDRLVYLHVPIDEGLEAAVVGIRNVFSPELDITRGGRFSDAREIYHTIISLRGAAQALGKRTIISPRATINAVAMHEAGFGKDMILEGTVFRGMSETDKGALMEAAGLHSKKK